MKLLATLALALLGTAAADVRARNNFFRDVADSQASNAAGKTYAVLVSGSSGYGNYRHQSDACHAYQVVKAGGVPDSQIITFIVDDLVTNPSNPYPGKLFNKPTEVGTPGVDVYAGCKLDYKGADVTPANFLAAIKGDESVAKHGSLAKATKEDNIFIFFTDHGGPGTLEFPRQSMPAKDVIAALNFMNDKHMFGNLVFYIEACYSASIVKDLLPAGANIYVTTASGPNESSWGTYCGPYDVVDGKRIGSCLGDLYSIAWMEDSDRHQKGQTMGEQFENVKNRTDKSKVMEFGDLRIRQAPVLAFQGQGKANLTPAMSKREEEFLEHARKYGSVPAPQIPLHNAYYNYLNAKQFSNEQADAFEILSQEVEMRAEADRTFKAIISEFEGMAPVNTNFLGADLYIHDLNQECIFQLEDTFLNSAECAFGRFNDFTSQYRRVFHHACADLPKNAAGYTVERTAARFTRAVRQACSSTMSA